jgi:excisionase family DNA binding protein
MNVLIQESELRQFLLEERKALLGEIRQILGSGGKAARNLNAKEAASYLGISISTLYKSLDRIPHKRFGKKLLFAQKELDDIRH